MKLQISNFEYKNLSDLNTDLRAAEVKFSFVHGRKFVLRDETSKPLLCSLNQVIASIKRAVDSAEVFSDQDLSELKNLYNTCIDLQEKGYADVSKGNRLTRMFLKLKHLFATRIRKRLLNPATFHINSLKISTSSKQEVIPPSDTDTSKISTSSKQEEGLPADINNLWKNYLELVRMNLKNWQGIASYKTLTHALDSISNPTEYSGMTSVDWHRVGNPMLRTNSAPGVFYIPDVIQDANQLQYPELTSDYIESTLSQTLDACFSKGFEMVVGRYGNSTHTVVCIFKANGEFVVLDSMFDHSINLAKMATSLNQAKIKNSQGAPISFTGKTINTHLQKDGNQCTLFTALYAKHIAESGDLDAYQEVNGAFFEGKLKTFEDIYHIPSTTRVANAQAISRDHYIDFMKSWVCRCYGYPCDDIKNIPISYLSRINLNDPFLIYINKKGEPETTLISLKEASRIPYIKLKSGKTVQLFSDEFYTLKNELPTYKTKKLKDLASTTSCWIMINDPLPANTSYLLALEPDEEIVQNVSAAGSAFTRTLFPHR